MDAVFFLTKACDVCRDGVLDVISLRFDVVAGCWCLFTHNPLRAQNLPHVFLEPLLELVFIALQATKHRSIVMKCAGCKTFTLIDVIAKNVLTFGLDPQSFRTNPQKKASQFEVNLTVLLKTNYATMLWLVTPCNVGSKPLCRLRSSGSLMVKSNKDKVW